MRLRRHRRCVSFDSPSKRAHDSEQIKAPRGESDVHRPEGLRQWRSHLPRLAARRRKAHRELPRLHHSPAVEAGRDSARPGKLSARLRRILRCRQARPQRDVEIPAAAFPVVGLFGPARQRGAIFGGAGGRPGPEPSFTVHCERQRADAADDDQRPGVGQHFRLFQQRHRLGAVGVARARSAWQEAQSRHSDRHREQSAAQCAQRPPSPAIAGAARRGQGQ